jgi:hypothetical protein
MEIVRMDECNIDLNSLPLDIDVMVHFPKFYYKGIYLPNNLYLYCFSLTPLLGYNEAYESLVGAYKGYGLIIWSSSVIRFYIPGMMRSIFARIFTEIRRLPDVFLWRG